MGNIDIGGMQRFGPQSSANLRLAQTVLSGQWDVTQTRGRHLLKAGALVEHYGDDMVNPTFSLGIYAFSNVRAFLENRPLRFVGLTPAGRHRSAMALHPVRHYAQDSLQLTPTVTVTGGLRYEMTTMPVDEGGRDSALINLSDAAPTVGRLYENPTLKNFSPRVGAAWDVFGDGSTALRGGYGLYFNTNNQQNLIVTVTNPPATPRVIIANPTFPQPALRARCRQLDPARSSSSSRTRGCTCGTSTCERMLPGDIVATVGYAGSRGLHLLRSGDVNVPAPVDEIDGRPVFPAAGTPRPNRNFSTIELKSSDGDSWYRRARVRAAPVLAERLRAAVVVHLVEDRGHDAGVDVLLGCDQRHDVGVPRVHSRLQQGPGRLGHAAQLGAERRPGRCRSREGRAGSPVRSSTVGR